MSDFDCQVCKGDHEDIFSVIQKIDSLPSSVHKSVTFTLCANCIVRIAEQDF